MKTFALALLLCPAIAGADTLKGNVLVWADASFYTDAADDATVVHGASLAERTAGQVVPMKVISTTKNGFVEVEPAAELDCTWSRLQASDDLAQLHLFVKREDLAPVLVDPFVKTFADGSRVELRPGVPLAATSDGRYVVGLRGHGDVIVELPAQAVGYAYAPIKSVKVAPAFGSTYELAPKTAVSIGDASVVLEGQRASAIAPHGASTVFSIKTKCVALDVVAPASAVHEIEDEDELSFEVSPGIAVMDLRDDQLIPKATILTTPTGRAIAASAKPIYLASLPTGKLACIERKIRIGAYEGDVAEPKDGDNKFKVCVAAKHVQHER